METDRQTDIATFRAAVAAKKTSEWSNDLNYTIRNNVNTLTTAWHFFNPIPHGGGGHICPPYHISAIFSGRTYPRRLQLYSKFKFCNYRAPEIGFGSKKFSYGAWDAAKVGWVVDILLRFCLKIGCNFSFHEMRWIFLVEIKL